MAVGLTWAVKASFTQYVEQVGGEVLPFEGAARTRDSFFFPYGGIFDGVLRFIGGVRFLAHGGLLDLELCSIQIAHAEDSMVVISVQDPVSETLRQIPMLRARAATREGETSANALTIERPTLLGTASDWFNGTYPAGTAFDDLHIVIPHPVCRDYSR